MSYPVVLARALSLVLFLAVALGCEKPTAKPEKLTFAAYSVPREAFGTAILPAYRKERAEAGKTISIAESYLASGAQSRAIAAGFDADVAVLSLEPDIQRLVEAKLVSPDWKTKSGGIVTRSVAVLGVRKGNPKNIQGWRDLIRDDVEVVTANPRTSGGAMWNVLAAMGAVERGHVPGFDPSRKGAERFLAEVLARVRIMDRSGRESMMTFERGVGDVIITYENEILAARKQGKLHDYIIPDSTIIIENPVAVVNTNAQKHGLVAESEQLVKFLFKEQAQLTFAEHGFRPVLAEAARATEGSFPPLKDSFSIEQFGDWASAQREIFAPNGLFERSLASSRAKK